MRGNKNKRSSGGAGAYKTISIAQKDRKVNSTNAAIPSEYNIEDGRDWINNNKK